MKNYFSLSGRMRSPTLLGIGVIVLFTPPIIRRLHDLGYSGLLSIGVIAIPYISILLLLFAGEKGSNVYGPDPTQKDVEPSAAPNSDPAESIGNSGRVGGEPPAVS